MFKCFLINDNISHKKKFLFRLKTIRRSQSREPYIYENGLLYFVKKKEFIKRNKIYPNKLELFVTDKYESLDINEYKDYLFAKNFKK